MPLFDCSSRVAAGERYAELQLDFDLVDEGGGGRHGGILAGDSTDLAPRFAKCVVLCMRVYVWLLEELPGPSCLPAVGSR